MKKTYSCPQCIAVSINTDRSFLANTIEGGEIGGTTGRFDAPRRPRQQSLYDEDEEWLY